MINRVILLTALVLAELLFATSAIAKSGEPPPVPCQFDIFYCVGEKK